MSAAAALKTIVEASEEETSISTTPPCSPEKTNEKEVILGPSAVHMEVQLNEEYNSRDALEKFKEILAESSAFDSDDIKQIEEEISHSNRRILKLRHLCNAASAYSDSVVWMGRKVSHRMRILKECEGIVDFKKARFSKLGTYFVQKQVGLRRDVEKLTTCAKPAGIKTNA